jgi:hypothetical protein
MTPLEAVLKIKAMFEQSGANFADPVPAPAADPMAEPAPAVEPTEGSKEYDLKAGGKVIIDKLEVGGKVTIESEVETEMPAPAGEHELVDGTKITVDELGIITAVTVASEPVVEPAPAEPSEAELKIAALEAELATLKASHAGFETKMAETDAKFSKAVSDLSDVIVGLINTPSAAPTERAKNSFNQHADTKAEKINRFLELAKSVNK